MAKKIFTYRGKNIEELKAMSMNDFAELLPSRQRRKMKRGFSDKEKLFVQKIQRKDNVKTHLRSMIILPMMIGKTLRIHVGNNYVPIQIQEEMIGCYIGELALTRKRTAHTAPGVGATRSSAGTKR